MGRSNGITLREVFAKYTEVAEKQIVVAEKQAEVQKDIATAMQKMGDRINDATQLSKSKLFWIIGACLIIAGGAIGIKLVFP